MKKVSMKLYIIENTGLENTIKATIKNPLSNSTFDGYVNFIR